MSGTRLDAHLAVHADAIRLRGARTKLLASNIANVDTPGYKARDLAFGDTLAQAVEQRLPVRATHGAHLNGAAGGDGSSTAQVRFRTPESASLDGNTVDKDMEQARFAENAIRYQASLQFMQNRVSSLLRSLKGE